MKAAIRSVTPKPILALARRVIGAQPFQEDRTALLLPLEPKIRAALESMYRGDAQLGSDGCVHAIDAKTKIGAAQGMWLHGLCRSFRPTSVLEIGMAYGYSTLYFIDALKKNGAGRITSIDPFQNKDWKGIGWTHTKAHAPELSDLIEERSDRALPTFAKHGRSFDLIFIDGNHRFDDVLVDFYLAAQVCKIGGHIAFDDMWMPSIQAVVAFVRANRVDLKELPAHSNTALFERVSEDVRQWDEFVPFATKR